MFNASTLLVLGMIVALFEGARQKYPKQLTRFLNFTTWGVQTGFTYMYNTIYYRCACFYELLSPETKQKVDTVYSYGEKAYTSSKYVGGKAVEYGQFGFLQGVKYSKLAYAELALRAKYLWQQSKPVAKEE